LLNIRYLLGLYDVLGQCESESNSPQKFVSSEFVDGDEDDDEPDAPVPDGGSAFLVGTSPLLYDEEDFTREYESLERSLSSLIGGQEAVLFVGDAHQNE